jgi:DNA-binding MarR family transcriptional regulator
MASIHERDPILQGYDLWVDNGWDDCAEGLAAVTSILRVRQVLTQRADHILAPIALSFARYQVLLAISLNDGALSLAQVSRVLRLHQTSVTGLIDKLAAQGLIARTRHATDRRITIAEMTPAAQSLLPEAIRLLNAELFPKLGLTTEEVRAMIAVMRKMRLSWGDFTEAVTPTDCCAASSLDTNSGRAGNC